MQEFAHLPRFERFSKKWVWERVWEWEKRWSVFPWSECVTTEVSDAFDHGSMFSEGFMDVKGERCMLTWEVVFLMIYAWLYVSVLCLICYLGLLDSFGPLWSYTWVYVCWGVGVYMGWVVERKEEMVCRWNWVRDELRFGSRKFMRPPNLLHGGLIATACPRVFVHVRLCLGDSAAEGAAEGAWVSSLERTFGRRTCRRKCPVQLSFACFAWIVEWV